MGKGIRGWGVVLGAVCAAAAARADTQEAEARAVRAFEQRGGNAQERIAALMGALQDAGLARTAAVALSALAADAHEAVAVREAARAELGKRALADPSLALALLAQVPSQGDAPPAALAVRLAREHLERALTLAPPEEGAAFQAMNDKPQGAAQAAAAEGDVPALVKPGEQPPPEGPRASRAELDEARALAASVPQGDARELEAHEVAGLVAIAAGDGDGAVREFGAIAQRRPDRGDGGSEARHARALLQLARLSYARGDDASAAAFYQRVGSGAHEWLDALFESSWAHFRKGDDEKALGNLLTLHAPFFQGRYFPESFILKALILYENCRYPDARRALTDFESRYRPLHDALAQTLAALPTSEKGYALLAGGPVALAQAVPAPGRDEVARVLAADDLVAARAAVAGLAQELDSIDRRAPAFQRSSLAQKVLPLVRKARLDLLQDAGGRLRARLAQERGDLRELLGQSLRLDYEIAGREKELATSGGAQVMRAPRERPQLDDDEVLWPFQGEYWRDELGSYQIRLGQRCAKKVQEQQQAGKPAGQSDARSAAPASATAATEPAPAP